MIRYGLKDTPQFELPAPYSIRPYQPGDDCVWRRIQLETEAYLEIGPRLFEEQFGFDQNTLRDRQFFLCDEQDTEIGTASAWFDPDHHGEPCGRVHWVAIVPNAQGRGLSKPLMSTVCNRLRNLGHDRACLGTHDVRLPAIGLYLKFGFVPEVRSEKDRQAWQGVFMRLYGSDRESVRKTIR